MKKRTLFLAAFTLIGLVSGCASPAVSSSSSIPSSESASSSSSIGNSSSSSSSSSVSSSETSSTTPSSAGSLDSTYYAGINWSATGDTLKNSLKTLLAGKCSRIINYDENNTLAATTDKDPSGKTNKIVGFYDRTLVGPAWDSGKTWNKEHVWPNSRGVGKTNAGADPQMIRPTWKEVNSSRGNKFYGEGNSTYTYDPGGEGYPEFRGMAARIIFYTATRWADTGLSLSDDPTDSTSEKTMGKVSDLLKWNLEYPVDPLETQRNEYLDTVNHVRNPFIDHPEAATAIWGTAA